MNESKIDLTERLRQEGRWSEASKSKDEIVKKLRADGMKRTEAREEAWEKMSEAYPPLIEAGQDCDPAVDEVTHLLHDAANFEVERWRQEYDVTLSDDARAALVGEEMMYFWTMGFIEKMPDSSSVSCENVGVSPSVEGCS